MARSPPVWGERHRSTPGTARRLPEGELTAYDVVAQRLARELFVRRDRAAESLSRTRPRSCACRRGKVTSSRPAENPKPELTIARGRARGTR